MVIFTVTLKNPVILLTLVLPLLLRILSTIGGIAIHDSWSRQRQLQSISIIVWLSPAPNHLPPTKKNKTNNNNNNNNRKLNGGKSTIPNCSTPPSLIREPSRLWPTFVQALLYLEKSGIVALTFKPLAFYFKILLWNYEPPRIQTGCQNSITRYLWGCKLVYTLRWNQ